MVALQCHPLRQEPENTASDPFIAISIIDLIGGWRNAFGEILLKTRFPVFNLILLLLTYIPLPRSS